MRARSEPSTDAMLERRRTGQPAGSAGWLAWRTPFYCTGIYSTIQYSTVQLDLPGLGPREGFRGDGGGE